MLNILWWKICMYVCMRGSLEIAEKCMRDSAVDYEGRYKRNQWQGTGLWPSFQPYFPLGPADSMGNIVTIHMKISPFWGKVDTLNVDIQMVQLDRNACSITKQLSHSLHAFTLCAKPTHVLTILLLLLRDGPLAIHWWVWLGECTCNKQPWTASAQMDCVTYYRRWWSKSFVLAHVNAITPLLICSATAGVKRFPSWPHAMPTTRS